MASSINLPSVPVPLGVSSFEIDAPARAIGATITLTRQSWPAGPLFTWRIYERERGKTLDFLAGGDEAGGEGFFKNGTPGAPLVIRLRFRPDADKDRIRIEINAVQTFNTGVRAEWDFA